MKRLLKLTAIIETATGLGLVAVPSVVVRLLLGSELGTSAAVMLARVAGAALLALGVACWLARDDTQSRAARGLVVTMLLYNIAVVALLAFAGLGLGLHGGGDSPRDHGRLVYCVPAAQSTNALTRGQTGRSEIGNNEFHWNEHEWLGVE